MLFLGGADERAAAVAARWSHHGATAIASLVLVDRHSPPGRWPAPAAVAGRLAAGWLLFGALARARPRPPARSATSRARCRSRPRPRRSSGAVSRSGQLAAHVAPLSAARWHDAAVRARSRHTRERRTCSPALASARCLPRPGRRACGAGARTARTTSLVAVAGSRRDRLPECEREPSRELDAGTKRFGGVAALDDVSLAVEAGSTVAPARAERRRQDDARVAPARPASPRSRPRPGRWARDPRDHRARAGSALTPQELAVPGDAAGQRARRASSRAHYPRRAGARRRARAIRTRARRRGGRSAGSRAASAAGSALALAFVGRPALVVLDEPTAALDVTAAPRVWDADRARRASGGSAVAPRDARPRRGGGASRTASSLIDRGRLVADGTVREVKARGRRPSRVSLRCRASARRLRRARVGRLASCSTPRRGRARRAARRRGVAAARSSRCGR